MTLKLPKTGEAVIIDIGEGKDIHPKNKQDVANRLARWALARDYGVKIAFQSPTYKAMEKHGNKIVLRFDHVGRGLKTFDVAEPRGFAIAGSDHKFVNAKAKIVGRADDRGLVGHGVGTGRRAVRLGRQPGLQCVQRRGPAPDAVPHRRLAGSDGSQRQVSSWR